MVDFVQNTLDGLTVGASYALLALGFTLIFGVMKRLNLAYGPSIMIGAYLGTVLYLEYSVGLLAVAVAVVAGAVLAGVYVERLCFAAVQARASADAGVASMVSSFAIWMQLEQAAVLALPRHTYPFPALVEGPPIELGPFFLRLDHLVIVGCAAALMVGLHGLLYRTRYGLALRALTENPLAARFMGVNAGLAMTGAFALASAIGGAAGFLILASDAQITPMFGMWATFKGLIAMMLGGLGSFPGAILGGLALGVVEAHSQWYLGPQQRDLVAYFLLFAVLLIRPGGLLGRRRVAAAAAVARRV